MGDGGMKTVFPGHFTHSFTVKYEKPPLAQ